MSANGCYKFDFTPAQWEELIETSFDLFEFEEGEALSRCRWLALAYMMLGKAQLIEEGRYGPSDEDEGVDLEQWADELRTIARIILDFFQPGDGKL